VSAASFPLHRGITAFGQSTAPMKATLRAASLPALLIGLSALACSDTTDPAGSSGGTPGAGGLPGSSGAAAGGANTGGIGTGGTGATAGVSTGGRVSAGGTAPALGGTNSGGAAPGTGGASKGGAAPGAGGAGPGTGGIAGGPSAGAGGGAVGGASSENTGKSCASTAGALKKNNKLPDPFAMNDGTRISSKAEWTCRRNEIKADLEKYEIGPKPEPPQVEATLSGNALSVTVTTSAGSIALSSTVGSVSGAGPHCVAIGMNVTSSLITGCVQVPFMHDQVVKYGSGSTQNQSDPFYKVYPELWGKVGNYSAWSWGISRLIDGLEQVKDQLEIDPTKIGVHGCSYAGKMALFAGALDERVALTVAQESGGGGITSWRTSQDFTTRTGTNIEKIDNTNYSWFLSSMKSLDPYSLPHDHHELIAMIAPRAVVALGNQDFEWLGDESGWKSINAAKEVWKALGIEDRIGFDFTSNHGHCEAPASQLASVKAFVDKFLKGQTANTAVAIAPQEGNFDLDFSKVIDWTTPTLN
jgi:hypothetical protein